MPNLESTSTNEAFLRAVEGYLGHLRAEILQAQNMRMQAHGAKIVFLGGLFAYALPRNDTLAMLVGPFAAFVFDCLAYGLSYNIHEIGAYIADHLERALPQPGPSSHSSSLVPHRFLYWQTARRHLKRKDWGRVFARFGNYLVTFLASIVSFWYAWPRIPPTIAATLLALLICLYAILIRFEFRSGDLGGTLALVSKGPSES